MTFIGFDVESCYYAPVQKTSYDCGPFVLLYIEKLLQEVATADIKEKEELERSIKKWDICQDDVVNLRKKVASLALASSRQS